MVVDKVGIDHYFRKQRERERGGGKLFENFLLVGRDGLILRGVGVVSHGGEARIPEERERALL
jgi:hypothetical protein